MDGCSVEQLNNPVPGPKVTGELRALLRQVAGGHLLNTEADGRPGGNRGSPPDWPEPLLDHARRHAYLRTLQTPSVGRAREEAYGRAHVGPSENGSPQLMGKEQAAFIAARDSFYIATVGAPGWPYVQHRGGPKGFLRLMGPSVLGFPDYSGNRQLISAGNVVAAGRVSLFRMDYPARERLKILGTCRVVPTGEAPTFVLLPDEPHPERVFVIDVIGYDWNCPKHITPRNTVEEVEEAVRPLRERIAELEAKLAGSARQVP